MLSIDRYACYFDFIVFSDFRQVSKGVDYEAVQSVRHTAYVVRVKRRFNLCPE